MIQVKQFVFNHIQVNCFVLWDEITKKCAIVDPGMETAHEDALLFQYIAEQGLTPTLILLTHAHVDHIAGLRQVSEKYGLPVTMHADGTKLLKQAPSWGSVLQFDVPRMDDIATNPIIDGDILRLGESEIETHFVPGHCPGSMVYVLHQEQIVFTGDALFRFSIGRTDFPGGDYNLLVERLRTRVFTLPDNYMILPGHGNCSSIGEELRGNPFLEGME